MTHRIARVRGEAFDADYLDIPTEHEDPAYPECPSCEEETINDAGWCPNCLDYAADMEAFMAAAAERWELKKLGDGWNRVAA